MPRPTWYPPAPSRQASEPGGAGSRATHHGNGTRTAVTPAEAMASKSTLETRAERKASIA